MLMIYIMAFTSGSFIKYIFDYNVMKPVYKCEDALNPGVFNITCTSDDICQLLDKGIQVKY